MQSEVNGPFRRTAPEREPNRSATRAAGKTTAMTESVRNDHRDVVADVSYPNIPEVERVDVLLNPGAEGTNILLNTANIRLVTAITIRTGRHKTYWSPTYGVTMTGALDKSGGGCN